MLPFPPGAVPLPALDPASTPAAIEARSFAIIDEATGPDRPFTGRAWSIARRLIHTSGDLDLVPDLCLPETAIEAGRAALAAGAPIFTDTRMAAAGIRRQANTREGGAIITRVTPLLSLPGLEDLAAAQGITRARAGMESLGERLGGSVLAIGNAPTALLALLDMLDAGTPPPALVIGMPVGFVNAAESKELLLARPIPSLVLRGRKGGSPLAAAAINALLALLE